MTSVWLTASTSGRPIYEKSGFVDILKSSPVRQLLTATGFSCVGSNALMAQGDTSRVQIKTMVSLASLGIG